MAALLALLLALTFGAPSDSGLPEVRQGMASPSPQMTLPTLDEAVASLTTRAEDGDAEALYRLGRYLEFADSAISGSSSPDYAEVLDYYKRAAGLGHLKAGVEVARLYQDVAEVKAMEPNSIVRSNLVWEYLQSAAHAGDAEAMGRYAVENIAFSADWDFTQTAYKYAKASADLGSPIGLNALGVLHQSGRVEVIGIDKDYGLAMKYLRQAAEGGSCVAQMNIGGLYYNGDGVPQDPDEAKRWFDSARACDAELASVTDRFTGNIREGKLPNPAAVEELSEAEVLAVASIVGVIAIAAAASNADAPPPPEQSDPYFERQPGWFDMEDPIQLWGTMMMMDQ
jgi:TPR repeat protein